jgi:hypothetical protein
MEPLLRDQEVDVIYCEVRFVPLMPGCTHFVELVGYLQNFGYQFMGFYNAIYQPHLMMDWCDIILASPKIIKKL